MVLNGLRFLDSFAPLPADVRVFTKMKRDSIKLKRRR